jgi:UDPglucose 6-dehydrogenase
MAATAGCHPQLLQAVMEINRDARQAFVTTLAGVVGDLAGKRIGVLGLAFKPNTDDMRDAPAVEIITTLLARGARVAAYDPMAMGNAEAVLPDVVYCATPYDVAKQADAVVIVTEWNEFKQLDFARLKQLMHRAVIVDGRNVHDPKLMAERGFVYRGVGRGVAHAPAPTPAPTAAGSALGQNGHHPAVEV